jgi:hypothetical protein
MAFNSQYFFPTEGLNYVLNVFPRAVNATPSNLYIGLFTTPWGTISGTYTPNTTLSGGTAASAGPGTYNVQEANFTNYARVAIPTPAWQNPVGVSFTVSGTVCGQSTTTNSGYAFTNSGTNATINGIFIASTSATNVSTSGTGSGTNTPTVIWYAPFSDLNAVTVASGDSITVTPTWQFAPNAG